MVARIGTVAFHGVEVQAVDVEVSISNGLPNFTIVGSNYPYPLIGRTAVKALMVLVALFSIMSPAIAQTEQQDTCILFGSEYVPHPLYKPRNGLNFILHITQARPGGMIRNIYLNFDAYTDGKKVSTMRFSDAWSNGDSRQSFSTYWGQYANLDDEKGEWKEFKPYADFYPIGVNEDGSPATIGDAPQTLIFPGSHWELRYNSFQSPEDWDKYIRFYTSERIYPDFRGIDFWVRKKCGTAADREY